MEQQVNLNDPRFKTAVIDILDEHIDVVLARIRTRLENEGHADAAKYVYRNFGS